MSDKDNTEERKQDMEEIQELGSVTTDNVIGSIHCIVIVGQVEGHQVLPPQNKTTKYEHVMPQLAAIEESQEIGGLLVLLNTVGGDIEAGLAIAELIAGMSKPTVSLVLGGGHSIGVPLAVAAKKSFVVPSAAMTIHPVRLNGMIIGVPQTFNYFEKIQDRIVKFVTRNSRITEKKFLELMLKTGELAADVGSVIDGQEAVEMGLIDQLGGLSDALNALHQMIDERNKEKEELENAENAAAQNGRNHKDEQTDPVKTGSEKQNKKESSARQDRKAEKINPPKQAKKSTKQNQNKGE